MLPGGSPVRPASVRGLIYSLCTAPQRGGYSQPVSKESPLCMSFSISWAAARTTASVSLQAAHPSAWLCSLTFYLHLSTRSCCWGCFLVTPFTLLRQTGDGGTLGSSVCGNLSSGRDVSPRGEGCRLWRPVCLAAQNPSSADC